MRSYHYFFKVFIIIPVLISLRYNLNAQDADDIFKEVNGSIVIVMGYDKDNNLSQGSGVVVNLDGSDYVVTNYHVLHGCETSDFKIIHGNEEIKSYRIEIYGIDIEKDLMILKIYNNEFPSLSMSNSDDIEVGEKVFAIGSPYGLENTISDGIISGFREDDLFNIKYIQITNPISPGSSGGALVNEDGELIGITTFGVKDEHAQNLNFAIPINEVNDIEILPYNQAFRSAYMNFTDFNFNCTQDYHQKDYSLCVKYITEAINECPDYESICMLYKLRGDFYFEFENYLSAIKDYTIVLKYEHDIDNVDDNEVLSKLKDAYEKLEY